MSHDERAHEIYVADCKAKKLPAAEYKEWLRITKPLGGMLVDYLR